MNDIFESVEEFEKRLNLPDGFYKKLVNEDDWSFIIKLSALFEAACTHALVTKLDKPELETCFSHLEQANARYGKVVLLKKMNVLYADQAKFLENLASLRNKMAHDISNVGFSLEDYAAQMDSNQKKSFAKWAGHGIYPEITIQGKTIKNIDFVIDNPKLSLWLTAAEILGCIYLEVDQAIYLQNTGVYRWLKNITSAGEGRS
ncbi:hypothetical protein [Vreelandella neptunia]|uniref:Uncharacterized protein n=1 Tax=Vreelandella neptunia TaxID=115551 RepID=A0ABS9S2U9_9GAMM|nr:hypothetical protein [Halomonas neptunia]MCH4810436.1 hypothetical protein [Halomonas neptunia]